MTLPDALAEVRWFWPGPLPFATCPGAAAGRLAAEFQRELPAELVVYLDAVAPAQDVELATVGDPLRLYGLKSLGGRQPGYNWNPVTQEVLADWPAFSCWPTKAATRCCWTSTSPSGAFRSCGTGRATGQRAPGRHAGPAAAVQRGAAPRAHPFESAPLLGNAHGLNLAPQAAAWLFPRLRVWAGPYYGAWCSAFDNVGR